ncbi:MAG: hypothetical protein RLZZ601_150 [Pseudomonadota bacterium]|jgi:hypothetical protein
MVRGLDVFTQWFKEFSDQYVLIGGTAASLAMKEFGVPFRGTKDLDVVLHLEALTPEFGEIFWKFIDTGGYEVKQKSDGSPRLYRFQKPRDENFPWMVELFSRLPEGVELFEGSRLSPIPMGDDISDMSAILLDGDYYDFVMSGRKMREGLTWIAEDRLIPLKALAWLNLTRSQEAGEAVRSGDIRKHLEDVVNLSNLLSPQTRVSLAFSISADLQEFIAKVNVDAHPDFAQVKGRLVLAYGLE